MVREFLGESGDFLKIFNLFLVCTVCLLLFLLSSSCVARGATFSCGAQVALLWLLLLQSTDSVTVTHGLSSCGFQHRPDDCGAWA